MDNDDDEDDDGDDEDDVDDNDDDDVDDDDCILCSPVFYIIILRFYGVLLLIKNVYNGVTLCELKNVYNTT